MVQQWMCPAVVLPTSPLGADGGRGERFEGPQESTEKSLGCKRDGGLRDRIWVEFETDRQTKKTETVVENRDEVIPIWEWFKAYNSIDGCQNPHGCISRGTIEMGEKNRDSAIKRINKGGKTCDKL